MYPQCLFSGNLATALSLSAGPQGSHGGGCNPEEREILVLPTLIMFVLYYLLLLKPEWTQMTRYFFSSFWALI